MSRYKCIIVEDEPLAAEVLTDYIKQVPFLELCGTCGNVFEASALLDATAVDLLFLDIHLPGMKGLDFLRSLTKSPSVILTTAYHEYAIQGYEFNALDYLVKPIEFSRFLAAVKKIRQVNSEPKDPGTTRERKSLFFSVNKKKVRIFTDEISYIESLREYIKVVTAQRTIITKMSLIQVEEMLNTENFVRVHRSFIVAKDKIDSYTAVSVDIGDVEIPVGRNFKESLFTVLGDSDN
ncbi:MAG: response regulator transcription factor [Chitinophagales bacterium]|nr:response regulator transcription factor [Chitinophagales bacterium]